MVCITSLLYIGYLCDTDMHTYITWAAPYLPFMWGSLKRITIWANFKFVWYTHIVSLILTRGLIILAKSHLMVIGCFSRWILSVHFIRVSATTTKHGQSLLWTHYRRSGYFCRKHVYSSGVCLPTRLWSHYVIVVVYFQTISTTDSLTSHVLVMPKGKTSQLKKKLIILS